MVQNEITPLNTNVDDYVNNRLKKQIEFYDRGAQKNKWKYQLLKTLSLFMSGSIPVMVAFVPKYSNITHIIGLICALLTFLNGMAVVFKFHEIWIEYHETSKQLKQEQYEFLNHTGIYKNGDPFGLFVERCENIINSD